MILEYKIVFLVFNTDKTKIQKSSLLKSFVLYTYICTLAIYYAVYKDFLYLEIRFRPKPENKIFWV